MRSGASAVQHLLSPAALGVLKHAVTEARRRGHPQVQPLHVVSMLLTHAGSRLRQACMLSHPQNAQTAECRALEVCFNVALDHLPQSAMATASQPILSNALMAALKRAHAHQRRGCPEHQHSPLLAVKVEIDQLIISILDDPSVSRVMKEAGFSSTNVKFNLEDGPASAAAAAAAAVTVASSGGHGVHEAQPPKHGADIASQGASFYENSCVVQENETKSSVKMPPGVMSQSTSLSSWQQSEVLLEVERREMMLRASSGVNTSMVGPAVSLPSREEDIRNMVEILLSPRNRNALLIGDTAVGANSVVEDLVSRLKTGLVPTQLAGLQFLDPKLSLSSFSHCSSLQMEQNLAELSKIVEECMPGGAILHIGDLQWLAEPMQLKKSPSNFCPAQRTAAELGNLLTKHANNRLWFVGVVTPHTFARLQVLHPSLASEWKLQSVQVTTAFQPPQTTFLQRFSSNLQQPLTDQQALIPLPVRGSSPMVAASVPVMPSSRYPGNTQVAQMNQTCCADCLSMFEEERRQLLENESLSLQLAPNKWLSSNDKVTSGGPSQTKTPPAVQQVPELLQKWQKFCGMHHGEASPVPTRSQQQLPSPLTRLPASSHSKPGGLGLDVSSQWSNRQDSHLGSSVVDQPLRTPLTIPLYVQAARDQSPLAQRTSEVVAPAKPSETPDFTSPKDGSSVASAQEDHEDPNLSTGTSAQDATASIQTNLALGRGSVPGKLRVQLQSHLSPLQSQARPLQSQPRPLQSQGSPFQSQGSPLQSQGSPLQSQGSPLQSQGSPLQSQGSPLQSQVSPLQSQVSPLQSQVSPLQSQVSPLQSQARPLQPQPSPLQSQPSPLQSLRPGASPLKASSGKPVWLTQSPLQKRALGGAPTQGAPAWSASPLASRQARVTKSPSPPPMVMKEVTVGESLKGLYKGLMQRVPWQGAAVAGIVATVMKCRGGESGFRGHTAKTDTWLLLLGPDPVAKFAIARALAEMVFGGERSLIHLGFALGTRHKLEADDSGVRYRSRTPLDRLAEAVRLKPNAVILLEDIDQADTLMRKGVQRAMEIGKLADSHGREVSFSNTIVIMTTSIGSELCEPTGVLAFSEAKLACLTNRPSIRGNIKDFRSEKIVFEPENRNVAVVERENPQLSAPSSSPNSLLPSWVHKRKPDAVLNMELRKRAKPSLNLDLNLSSGWTGESDHDDEEAKLQMVLAQARSALSEKFCSLPDYAVSFEAYDFHRLSTEVLSKLGKTLELHGPREVALEVDHQLLEYVISCVWRMPEGQQAFTTWLEDVFAKSLADTRLCGAASVLELALEDGCVGDGGNVALPRRVVYDDSTSF